jgi:4-coumarate--CoA ligase
MPRIYSSASPSVHISNESIFTRLFKTDPSTGYIGGYPGSHPAFIDAPTSTTLSRSTLKSLALSLGHGLTSPDYPGRLQNLGKGDTIMIFSPNSLAWPIVLFGAVAAGLRCTLANSAYTATELKYQWADSGAKVVFVHPGLMSVVREMFKTELGLGEEEIRTRVVICGTEWLTGAKDEGASTPCLSSLSF